MAMRPHLIIPAVTKHTATVIFLHGLGDSGYGWPEAILNEIREPHIKYICPHASERSVTINGGAVMPSWFDIFGLKVDSKLDEKGIKAAAKKVHSWLDAEISVQIPVNRIVLAGFSQGGSLALYSGLTYPKRLAGLVALSCRFLLHNELPGENKTNIDVPIFQAHGDRDILTKLDVAEFYVKHIQTFNPNHLFTVYPGMGHEVFPEEIKNIRTFLAEVIPPI